MLTFLQIFNIMGGGGINDLDFVDVLENAYSLL